MRSPGRVDRLLRERESVRPVTYDVDEFESFPALTATEVEVPSVSAYAQHIVMGGREMDLDQVSLIARASTSPTPVRFGLYAVGGAGPPGGPSADIAGRWSAGLVADLGGLEVPVSAQLARHILDVPGKVRLRAARRYLLVVRVDGSGGGALLALRTGHDFGPQTAYRVESLVGPWERSIQPRPNTHVRPIYFCLRSRRGVQLYGVPGVG